MRHLFIINPAAGKKDRSAMVSEEVETAARAAGIEYEVYITKQPMDACRKIREAASACDDILRVYACGGDGTLNECANGAAHLENVELTHFPTGTGNDFVKTFGPDESLFSDLGQLMDGESLPLDLINCNGRYGLNICSVGIDARIGGDVHKYSSIPLIGGATGYVTSLLVNIIKGINQELTIRVDGRDYEGGRSLVCACNGRYYGGGFNPIPEAEPDDGVIDFLIVEPVSRAGFLSMVGRYAKGRYAELPIIKREAGRLMTIEAREELAVNIDGEILRDRRVSFSMESGAVNFVFPKSSQFVKTRKTKIGAIA